MLPRYTRPQMAAIWAPENRFRIWFEIEAHACDAMAATRDHPQGRRQGDLGGRQESDGRAAGRSQGQRREDRRHRARDQARRHRLPDLAGRVHRPAVALRAPGHDLVGRARHQLLRPAHRGRRHPAGRRRPPARRAQEGALQHKDTLTIGRSHGIHAEPTTFGVKSRPAPSRGRSAPSPTSIRGSRSTSPRSSASASSRSPRR